MTDEPTINIDAAGFCAKQGCNKRLNANNKTGYCANHWYLCDKAKAKAASKKKPATMDTTGIATEEVQAGIDSFAEREAHTLNEGRFSRMVREAAVEVGGIRYVASDAADGAQMLLANGSVITVIVDPANPAEALAISATARKLADLRAEQLVNSETPHADAYLERCRTRREATATAVNEEPAGDGAMTLLMTPKQADRFFSALSLDDKCSLIQSLFDRLGE
jgi:hypothetical protein